MSELDSQSLSSSISENLKSGNVEQALESLKKARKLALSDYSCAAKFSKYARKAARAQSASDAKKIKLAILSSSTTTFLEPLFAYFGLIDGIDFLTKSGDFGNWRQDILSPASWLYEFQPDFVFITLNHRDILPPLFSKSPNEQAEKIAESAAVYWRKIREISPKTRIIQSDIVPNPFDSSSLLASKFGGRNDLIARVSSNLRELASRSEGVDILPLSEIAARFGLDKWEDNRMWFHAKQYPSLNALPSVADACARLVGAASFAPKKVCVLDLDNTLWGGIIGEDGLGGIVLGAPNARGEAYATFQTYLKELKQRGILLCVCSKNNEADARLPFEKHSAMVLKETDIVCFSASWNPKSQSIKEMAATLNLGLDSFVFLDDNPAEIAEVSANLPMVTSLLLPEDPADFAEFLSGQHLFDTLVLSEDDLKRSDTYLQNVSRMNLMANSADLGDYLKSLEMKCAAEWIGAENIARCVQLLGKTNQFNFTTRRETCAEVEQIAADSSNYAKCFRLTDKFGDNGIVAVVLASASQKDTLCIDSFIMSCRVIGRGLEDFIIDDIISYALAKGYKTVEGVYIPTKKNSQVSEFYTKRGFSVKSHTDCETRFCIEAENFKRIDTYISLPQ